MNRTINARLIGLSGLTVLMLFFAGCTADKAAESGIQSAHDVTLFNGNYTWTPPVVTDTQGNELSLPPLLQDKASQPQLVYQLLPKSGPEPSLGITKAKNAFVATLDKVQTSGDSGRNWKVVYDYTGPTTYDTYSTMDPMLYVDPDTSWIFNTHLESGPDAGAVTGALGIGPWCIYMSHSSDEGKTWSDHSPVTGDLRVPGVNSCLVGIADHQKVAAAKLGPQTSAATKAQYDATPNKYPKVLYYCRQMYNWIGAGPIVINQQQIADTTQNPVVGTWCDMSFDAGTTWTYSQQVAPYALGCGAGINGQPAPFPDGTIAVPLGALGDMCTPQPTVAVSEDSGRTWTTKTMPKDRVGETEVDPDITVTPDGTAYYTYRGKDHHIWIARSKDKFNTWEGPWRVSPLDQTLNAFVSVVSGDNGRIAVTYLGTREAQEREATPSNATGGSLWHAFVSYSFDADSQNMTFFTQQVTPQEDPVQVGCIWFKGGGGGPKRCRNLLDFIDSSIDADGRVYTAITDGCTPRSGCSGDTDSVSYQSHDSDTALLVQNSGLSLYAEKGILPPLGLVPPHPFPR